MNGDGADGMHYIDNVRIYDRALPDSQIIDLYLYEKTYEPPRGTVISVR